MRGAASCVLDGLPHQCAQILDLIGKLAEIEKRAGEDENERRRLRSRARSSGRSSAGSSRCGPCQARRSLHLAITYDRRWVG
ncbi:MAG: hypothetical protein U0359_04465 [Byssovorax sp.]